jgi:hypothetical protein
MSRPDASALAKVLCWPSANNRSNRLSAIGLLVFILLFCSISVRANVYATDIRINGSMNAGVIIPGSQVTVSYILNENASLGMFVKVIAGTNVVWTNAMAGGSAGTMVGSNSFVWNGTNNAGGQVSPGVYQVSITAASAGYLTWTNITDDGPNFYAPTPRGIDVNKNTNSPYYGRVFVSATSPVWGIFKCNADGSPADEGGFSSGGLPWGTGQPQGASHYGPWKIAIGGDDTVYIDDLTGSGLVYGFDETIETNGYSDALREDNYPPADPSSYLGGLYVTGTGTNAYIWMTDVQTATTSAGILRWELTSNDVTVSNDPGTVVVPVIPGGALNLAPYDVAVDTNGCIYTMQMVQTNNLPPTNAVMCFPPYAGIPETNPLWTVGFDPTLYNASGIAVDQTATYVAVAIRGKGFDPEYPGTGLLNLYYATNGVFFINLDQTGGDQYTDVAWDNAGNLYALDDAAQVWRVYSPPGTNQATTVAAPIIQAYNAFIWPMLLNPNVDTNGINFTLQGQNNVTYWIEQSPDMMTWTPVATNYSPFATRAISIPFADNQDFYRAVVGQ